MSSSKQRGIAYRNNPNLPTPRAEFEYTPEMVSEIKKSKSNLLHFAKNHFYILNLDEGRQKIKLHSYQTRLLKAFRDHRFCITVSSRQIGKTTCLTIYALWLACFSKDQRILIVANKESTAIEVFQRIRMAYEELENYLKPGVVEYGKTSMELANGSRIDISTTTGTAARGKSVNCLLLDEFAYVENDKEFWRSVYPIISSGKTSKILITSTPNGTNNLFYELYRDAVAGKNGWHPEKVMWFEVPGRDENWRDITLKTLGSIEAFQVEYECEFISLGDGILDEETFHRLKQGICKPKIELDGGDYLIWEEPNPEHIYVAGVDVAEGIGRDYSVIQIFDITNLCEIKQVARFSSNEMSVIMFTKRVEEIFEHWGCPLALIERNNHGAQVVDRMSENGYPNLVSYGGSASSYRKNFRPGILSHYNTKMRAIANYRYWLLQSQSLVIRDEVTLQEMKYFAKLNDKRWAASVGHDDHVMALILAILILDNDLIETFFNVLEYDATNHPLIIKPLDYGINYFKNTSTSVYSQEFSHKKKPLPVLYSHNNTSEGDQEMAFLMSQGWVPLNN